MKYFRFYSRLWLVPLLLIVSLLLLLISLWFGIFIGLLVILYISPFTWSVAHLSDSGVKITYLKKTIFKFLWNDIVNIKYSIYGRFGSGPVMLTVMLKTGKTRTFEINKKIYDYFKEKMPSGDLKQKMESITRRYNLG